MPTQSTFLARLSRFLNTHRGRFRCLLLVVVALALGILLVDWIVSRPARAVVAGGAGMVRTPADQARLAESILLWGGLGLALVVSLIVLTMAVADTIWRTRGGLGRRRCIALVVIGVGAALLRMIMDLLDRSSGMLDLSAVDAAGVLRFPLWTITLIPNALGALAIAGLLLSGVGLICKAKRVGAPGVPALQDRLRMLLLLGSLCTALGVIEVGALHRLGGAVLSGAAINAAERGELERSIDATLREGRTDPILAAWLKAAAPDERLSDLYSKLAENPSTPPAAPVPPVIQAQIRSAILGARDEAVRKAAVAAYEPAVQAVAAFWGTVFVTVLIVFYVPVAAVLGAQANQSFISAMSGVPAAAGAPVDLLLRVLTALAPLLATPVAELLGRLIKAAGGS